MNFAETESVELKEKLNDNFIKVAISFLNTLNGTIYIGVKDNGYILGVENIDKVLKEIADIVTTQILPNPQELIEIGTKYVDGKSVIEVKVKKGNSLYYIKKYGRSATGCYIRVGSTSRSMTEEQIEERYITTLTIPQKSIIEMPVLRDDFTFAKLKNYLISKGFHISDDTFFKNFNLLTSDGKYNVMAEMLADENSNSVKVSVFKGKDKSEFLKRNEYGYTCLLDSLQKVLDYCDALNETFIDVSVRPRKEKRLFSSEAFKEAWINACVHNKWSDVIAPAVYWFEDRLEIVSYGGIPKNLTKEEFLAGKTEPVNKELMKIFLQCGIVEQSGHGVPIVVREYGAKAYKFSENMITVVIPFSKAVGINDAENDAEKTLEDLVVELIRANPKISKIKMAAVTGKSKPTIERMIKKSERIRRVGAAKGGYWEILEKS